jgi:hypothetical protein
MEPIQDDIETVRQGIENARSFELDPVEKRMADDADAALDRLVAERDHARREAVYGGKQMVKLQLERDRLIQAATAFLRKYDQLKPAMDGAFAMAANHGMPYSGPTWEAEINDLRALTEK